MKARENAPTSIARMHYLKQLISLPSVGEIFFLFQRCASDVTPPEPAKQPDKKKTAAAGITPRT